MKINGLDLTSWARVHQMDCPVPTCEWVSKEHDSLRDVRTDVYAHISAKHTILELVDTVVAMKSVLDQHLSASDSEN